MRRSASPVAAGSFGFSVSGAFSGRFVVALVLFSLGSVFAVYEGIQKLIHPRAVDHPTVGLVVLGVALVLECVSMRTAARAAREERGDRSWWRFIRTAKAPELPVVLLEDFGALVGLVLAAAVTHAGAPQSQSAGTYPSSHSILFSASLDLNSLQETIEEHSLSSTASAQDAAARNFFVGMAIILLVVVALTDYSQRVVRPPQDPSDRRQWRGPS